jgi:activating signal cointegrator 1
LIVFLFPWIFVRVEAWNRKEMLLQFDRESAERTVVIDDQNDYYTTSTSQWVTEDERAIASELEETRSNNLHQRKNMTLNVTF